MSKSPARFFLIFGLSWTAIVGLFDVIILHTFVSQARSRSYVATPGHIISSELTTSSDSDGGTTYGARVVYDYEVAGRRYQSERVRFGQGSDSSGHWAHATLKAFPPGATPPVYYDPADPARAVLQTGVAGQDWFLALFLTPFNVVMGFLWTLSIKSLRPAPLLGGARIEMEPGRILIRMKSVSPAGLVLGVFGGVSFLGMFAVVIPFGFSPKTECVWLVWGVAAISAVVAALKSRKPAAPYAIIDADRGVLSLPQGQFTAVKNWTEWKAWKNAGRPPLNIPLEHIRSVDARERVTNSSDGKSTSYVVAVSVQVQDAESLREYDLGSWMLSSGAEAFAVWLRETLGLSTAGAAR